MQATSLEDLDDSRHATIHVITAEGDKVPISREDAWCMGVLKTPMDSGEDVNDTRLNVSTSSLRFVREYLKIMRDRHEYATRPIAPIAPFEWAKGVVHTLECVCLPEEVAFLKDVTHTLGNPIDGPQDEAKEGDKRLAMFFQDVIYLDMGRLRELMATLLAAFVKNGAAEQIKQRVGAETPSWSQTEGFAPLDTLSAMEKKARSDKRREAQALRKQRSLRSDEEGDETRAKTASCSRSPSRVRSRSRSPLRDTVRSSPPQADSPQTHDDDEEEAELIRSHFLLASSPPRRVSRSRSPPPPPRKGRKK